jgi:hypothetical protein
MHRAAKHRRKAKFALQPHDEAAHDPHDYHPRHDKVNAPNAFL